MINNAAQPEQPFRIGMIVGLDLIGDALLKLPVLRALRAAYPKAQIHWITAQGKTAYSGPLRALTSPLIDEINETPSWLASKTNQVPSGEAPFFDLLIDTRNRWREALRAKNSVPCKLFISPALRFLFSDKRPSFFAKRPNHMVDRILQQIEIVAGELPPSSGRLPVPDEFMASAREILPEGLTYVGFAPGAGNKIKAWPLDNFVSVALEQAAKGRIPVFLLGPDEVDWQPRLANDVPSAKFPLQDYETWSCTPIKLEQTLAIGSLLTLAVVNDSGTSHMLAAVDCPLVSLFGPTSPAKFTPPVTHSRVMRAQDFGGSAMHLIPSEKVNDAVNLMIGQLSQTSDRAAN